MSEPYYRDDAVTLYHGDCLQITEWLAADVLVTDPPYGIGYDRNAGKHRHDNHRTNLAVAGDAEPFDPAHLLAFKRAVIFGGNCFSSRLPDSPQWIVWDKVTRNGLDVRIAECEMAWTRGVIGRSRMIRHMWSGAFRDSERGVSDHPTQKPLVVMQWIVELASKSGDVIADPYAGSGSTLVAAKYLGRRAIGVELEERYCEVIARRLAQDVLDFGGEAS